MITKVIAWDYIKEDTRIYVIEDKVYFCRNNSPHISYIQAKDFDIEENRVLDLFYWLP